MRIIAKKPLLNFTHNIPKLNFLWKIGIEKLLLPNGLVLQNIKKDFNSVDAVGMVDLFSISKATTLE